jgi:hypothetical protein
MLKYLLAFLFAFSLLPCSSQARPDIVAALKQEYGQDLTHVPFYLRYAFLKAYHKDWENSYYIERESFLKDYKENLAIQNAKDRAEEKAEADAEKARQQAKQDELRKQQDRLKAELAEEKAEEDDDYQRQKEFDDTIKQQEQQLQQMQLQMQQQR